MKVTKFNSPNIEIGQIARNYKLVNNLLVWEGANIYEICPLYCKYVADKFEQIEHEPTNVYVRSSYDALISETLEQYKILIDNGYKCELYTGKGEPYKSSREMMAHVSLYKELEILSTANDFGNEPISEEQRLNNPMLADSGYKDINGKTLLVNDVFRFVHDIFGHCVRGNGFGPVGEYNAWDCHARMFTSLALYALTTETLAQNCWVNFGPHMRNDKGELIKEGEAGYLKPSERPFAPQKVGLLSNFVYPKIH